MCTTICFNNNKDYIVGNNQDTFFKKGYIFTNQRGIKKTALIMPPEKPLEWISKYGSTSFSQCGKEFPSGGMNEEGLVVAQMTLPETSYPKIDGRPGINQMQVIQYLLDTCDNVDQVVTAFSHLRITQASWTIHYMIFDKQGSSAIIEFLKGEIVIYQDEELEVKVLANSSYFDSLYYLRDGKNQTGDILDPYNRVSIERFSKGVDFALGFQENIQSPIDYIIKALETVRLEGTTWTLIYDIKSLTVYCTRNFSDIKSFSLKEMDFARGAMSQVLDVSAIITGETIKTFKAYTREINRELVNSFFKDKTTTDVMKILIPDEALEYFIMYPEQMI
jgi:penicillin V acylase-like amidase (Ntn superfamily)